MSILIVAPNPCWVPPLTDLLQARDHPVEVAADAARGLQAVLSRPWDALIVDWHIPDMDCVHFCARLRADSSVRHPLIVVGPGDRLEDKLAAFDAGCDDFLTQPFENLELLARLGALWRRSNSIKKINKILQVHDLKYNIDTCEAFRADRSVRLGPICRKLLEVLLDEAPRVVTRERLQREIWGNSIPERDLLRSHMSMLRKAVDEGQSCKLIHTVHGTGFRIVSPTSG